MAVVNEAAEALAVQNRLWSLFRGTWISRAISVTAKLGIADVMAAGKSNPEAIAAEIGVLPDRLRRLLRALATVDVVEERSPDDYRLTEMGRLLAKSSPNSLNTMAYLNGDYWSETWDLLEDALKAPIVAFQQAKGAPLFQWIKENEGEAARFHAFIRESARLETSGAVEAFDFSKFRHVVDVGGGNGSLISGIIAKYPSVKATLFDLPEGIAAARRGEGGPLPGVELIAGDAFKSAPEGADLYVLRHVINDFNDEQSALMLSNVSKAMAPGARVLILESPITDDPRSTHSKWLDLHMMLMFNGKSRTVADYERVLNAAGLKMDKVTHTNHPLLAIMEAVAA